MKEQVRITYLLRALAVISVLVLAALSTHSVFAASSAGNVLYGKYCDGGGNGDAPYVAPVGVNNADQSVSFDGETAIDNLVSAPVDTGMYTNYIMAPSANDTNGIAYLRELGF
jgi:hypothetical protein